jgi:exodeoxyribonuclease VII large subunit
MAEQLPITVSALNKYLRAKFQADRNLQSILLRGEISNFKRHSSSGHFYFTLKDDNGRISAVMFRQHNVNIAFEPQDGMQVIVQGEVTVYPQSGSYQIYVNNMQPDGIGSLYIAFEQLKKKLQEEGLFDQQYKKEIPSFPSVIGVITSPTGAAIRDIITTIQRRYPIGKIIVIPTLVQGQQAPDSIVKSIDIANNIPEIDVLIVGRGGGSIEELWAFNEEIVARAIFNSRIPIISAVGHETDTTISDFVADLRAATPTAAAEQVSISQRELQEQISTLDNRLAKAMNTVIERKQVILNNVQESYIFRNPQSFLNPKQERYDRTYDDLIGSFKQIMSDKGLQLRELSSSLFVHHPKNRIQLEKQKYGQLSSSLTKELMSIMMKKQYNMEKVIHQLDALSPLKVMSRGYSLAYKNGEELIKNVGQVEKGESFDLQVTDGTILCEVIGKKES